jgi:hypothetical protein
VRAAPAQRCVVVVVVVIIVIGAHAHQGWT